LPNSIPGCSCLGCLLVGELPDTPFAHLACCCWERVMLNVALLLHCMVAVALHTSHGWWGTWCLQGMRFHSNAAALCNNAHVCMYSVKTACFHWSIPSPPPLSSEHAASFSCHFPLPSIPFLEIVCCIVLLDRRPWFHCKQQQRYHVISLVISGFWTKLLQQSEWESL
jgi:hypothetical protein